MISGKQAAILEAANVLHKARDGVFDIRSHVCFTAEDARVIDDIVERIDALFTRLIPNEREAREAE